jgi:diguanylate cyclase (GGDEF)-like protein
MTSSPARAGERDAESAVISGLGPVRRSAILIAMSVIAGTTFGLVAFLSLGSSAGDLSALTTRNVPALRALQTTIISATQTQMNTHAVLASTDIATRTKDLQATAQSDNLQQIDWQQYEKFAITGPVEQTLGQAYLAAASRARTIGTAAIAAPAGSADLPGLINEYRTASAAELAALGSLETTVYAPLVGTESAGAHTSIDGARRNIAIAFGAIFLLCGAIGAVLFKGARREQASMITESATLRLTSARADFEASLQRGLEMAPTQEATLEILAQALTMVTGDVGADLILADSSLAHFEGVLATTERTAPICDVTTPGDCPACAGGQPRLFADNAFLDTCRFLRGKPPAWTMCVPVSIAGQTVGVIRSQGSLALPPEASLTTDLALVARKAGERLGTQRVLARTEKQARSDPLTGLPNRRAFEAEVSRRQLRDAPYVIAYADLDHFKLINDTHGHDVGDRALRIFAQVLRDTIRPGDVLSRYGGEEFVALLAGCTILEAREIGGRVRSQLAKAVGHGGVPAFTVTMGLAEAMPSDVLVDVIANADAAMLLAKSLGRDRVFAVGDLDTALSAEPPALVAAGSGAVPPVAPEA